MNERRATLISALLSALLPMVAESPLPQVKRLTLSGVPK
jgi:hypothetical protein